MAPDHFWDYAHFFALVITRKDPPLFFAHYPKEYKAIATS